MSNIIKASDVFITIKKDGKETRLFPESVDWNEMDKFMLEQARIPGKTIFKSTRLGPPSPLERAYFGKQPNLIIWDDPHKDVTDEMREDVYLMFQDMVQKGHLPDTQWTTQTEGEAKPFDIKAFHEAAETLKKIGTSIPPIIKVLEDINMVERNTFQFRFPKSKGKRIKKKWRKNRANWKTVCKPLPEVLVFNRNIVAHPDIARKIRKALEDDSCPMPAQNDPPEDKYYAVPNGWYPFVPPIEPTS